jgi:5-methylcytosine-specific restriction endonuclease McrA
MRITDELIELGRNPDGSFDLVEWIRALDNGILLEVSNEIARMEKKAKNAKPPKLSAEEKRDRNKARCVTYHAEHKEERSIKKKEWRASHKGEEKEYRAAYYKANKERLRANGKEWHKKNRPKVLAYFSERYRSNPQKYKAQSREWYKKNPDKVAAFESRSPAKVRAYAKKRRKEKPEEVRLIQATYRARKMGCTKGSAASIARWDKSWRFRKTARCFWCNSKVPTKDCHADHILALSKGGKHEIGNLCISCSHCNLRKSSQSIEKWNTKLVQPVLL